MRPRIYSWSRELAKEGYILVWLGRDMSYMILVRTNILTALIQQQLAEFSLKEIRAQCSGIWGKAKYPKRLPPSALSVTLGRPAIG